MHRRQTQLLKANSELSIKRTRFTKDTVCKGRSGFSDDWSKGSEETWGERYFGDCKGHEFTVSMKYLQSYLDTFIYDNLS